MRNRFLDTHFLKTLPQNTPATNATKNNQKEEKKFNTHECNQKKLTHKHSHSRNDQRIKYTPQAYYDF